MEQYRPHAAIEKLANLQRRVSRYVAARIPTERLRGPDVPSLDRSLKRYAESLFPIAPHLAEEGLRLLGTRQDAQALGLP